MALPDLLQWLSQGQRTGTLVISDGEVDKSIFFRDGAIISSASTDPKEYLGHFLVSHGFIDEAQLARAVGQQVVSRKLLGMILIELGVISEGDLEHMLRLKAEEGIYALFSWSEGDFDFHDGRLPEYEMVQISLNVQSLLLHGMQQMDEWKEIRVRIPSAEAVPVAVADLLDDDSLGERELSVLNAVNDDRSIEEICLHTHTSEYFVCRVLFDKLGEGKLKVVRPRTFDSAAMPRATSPFSLLTTAKELLSRGELELGYRHLRAARSLDPTNGDLLVGIQESEEQIREQLAIEGVEGSHVPILATSLKELSSFDLTPQEGFILSRINETSDLASIVTISPLPEFEALLVFWKLLKGGHIRLEPPASLKKYREGPEPG